MRFRNKGDWYASGSSLTIYPTKQNLGELTDDCFSDSTATESDEEAEEQWSYDKIDRNIFQEIINHTKGCKGDPLRGY